MSKEEFLKLMPTPRKENDGMPNISCPYIDDGMISILAQLTGEQLKEVFVRLNTCGLNDIYVEPEDKVNPMVAVILHEISRRGLQRGRYIIGGRYIIDCIGETI